MDTRGLSAYVRLSGPLQSWATGSLTGNRVYTQPHPTASALRGMIAAALGMGRLQWPEWLNNLEFTVRVDRPGEVVDDFHTINPRTENRWFYGRLYLLEVGKKPPKDYEFTPDSRSGSSIVRRTYLADAEFIVEIRSPQNLDQVVEALASPEFAIYLGRKAFAPCFPFFLGVGESGLLTELPTLATGRPSVLSADGSVLVDVDSVGFEAWMKQIGEMLAIPR